MIKLIACDLDGTLLLGDAKELRKETPDLIRQLKAQGRIFVAASGRQYRNLQQLFAPVKDEIAYICENGALVISGGEILFQHEIPKDQGQEIIKKIMARPEAECLLSGVKTSYIQPKDPDFAEHMRKVVGNDVTVVPEILDTGEAYLKIAIYEKGGISVSIDYWQHCFENEPGISVVTSGNAWIDVIPDGIHKGSAIKALGDHLGIGPEEMMAVGDNYNDLEMLKYVKYNVSMSNAAGALRKACRYETGLAEDLLSEIVEGKYD